MDKRAFIKIVLYSLIASIGFGVVDVSAKTENKSNIGRSDPFAGLSNKKKTSIIEGVLKPLGLDKQKSELFVETVTIKSINANSLMNVIKKMISESGSISTDTKSNSLIICDIKENLEKILVQIERADSLPIPEQSITEAAPEPKLFVETITLKFLDAKNLKAALASLSSTKGIISIDTKSNSLIVCDTEEKLKEILEQIKIADKMPKQIMIEVVILDVQLEDDTEIGVNWDSIFGPSADEQYTQVLNTLTTGATFSITKIDIKAALKALQEKRNVEILASPRVLVVSGYEAYIKTIEEIPYDVVITSTETGTSSGITGLTNVEFKEIGITLKVKATVTDQNMIMMTIEPEQSIDAGTASTTSASNVPKVDTRSAKTTLLMEDGQIVIMGGLRKKEKQIIRKQVPFLGDLPLIGFLFTSNKEVIKHSELIVMISPHIQKFGDGLNDKQMEKFNELKNMPMLSLSASTSKNITKKPSQIATPKLPLQSYEDDVIKKELMSIITFEK